jgi:hypothetical protein
MVRSCYYLPTSPDLQGIYILVTPREEAGRAFSDQGWFQFENFNLDHVLAHLVVFNSKSMSLCQNLDQQANSFNLYPPTITNTKVFLYKFIMACTFPFLINGSHKIFLESIKQLKRNSNITQYACCITDQGPLFWDKGSDRNKATLCLSW